MKKNRDITVNYRYISYNKLNNHNKSSISPKAGHYFDIVAPYVSKKVISQCKIVLPITIYLFLFLVLLLKFPASTGITVIPGVISLIAGLVLFMEGLKHGIMPLGELAGELLPEKGKFVVVLLASLILGITATIAEPAMSVLTEAGRMGAAGDSVILTALLTDYSNYTVASIAIGVGIAIVLGMFMIVYAWSLKPIVISLIVPLLAFSIYFYFHCSLNAVIGFAWDCGAITTGPVTVPVVLSLGMGMSKIVKKKRKSAIPGFGLVAIASLTPVLAVMVTALLINNFLPADYSPSTFEITAVARNGSFFELVSPFFSAFRAVLPLVVFIIVLIKFVLKSKIPYIDLKIFGLVLTVVGLGMFYMGLEYGLYPLGELTGQNAPGLYTTIETVTGSPFFKVAIGFVIISLFAFFLGYLSTIAEPALNSLGDTVENITNGSVRKIIIMTSVSTGVGLGLLLGVLKTSLDIPVVVFVVPLYVVALLLTLVSKEKFINIAWDSAGVTTGPVTVPMVMALGIGITVSLSRTEGFGFLALSSAISISSVLFVGIYANITKKLIKRKKEKK